MTTKQQTQTASILHYLERGGSLTPLDALRLFGCLRLGGRIFDLRAQGWNIETHMVATEGGAHVASYRLAGAK